MTDTHAPVSYAGALRSVPDRARWSRKDHPRDHFLRVTPTNRSGPKLTTKDHVHTCLVRHYGMTFKEVFSVYKYAKNLFEVEFFDKNATQKFSKTNRALQRNQQRLRTIELPGNSFRTITVTRVLSTYPDKDIREALEDYGQIKIQKKEKRPSVQTQTVAASEMALGSTTCH